jgi:hypothetical protein
MTILKITAKMATIMAAMAAIFKSHLSLSHSSGRKSSKYQFPLKCINKNVDTVKPALVTTSIKQHLVLCDLRFYFPSQCISYQLNLY